MSMVRLTENFRGVGNCGITKHAMTSDGKANLSRFADKVITKLADYEDAEEQGLLLRLPCKVGDTIYKIPSKVAYKLNVLNGYLNNNKVYEQKIYYIKMYNSSRYLIATCEGLDSVLSDEYKKTWFLTREEAEQELKRMESK